MYLFNIMYRVFRILLLPLKDVSAEDGLSGKGSHFGSRILLLMSRVKCEHRPMEMTAIQK
jgi:hypothetical protein